MLIWNSMLDDATLYFCGGLCCHSGDFINVYIAWLLREELCLFAYKFSHALTFETYTITQGRFDMHYLVVWLERILKWNTAFSNSMPSFLLSSVDV